VALRSPYSLSGRNGQVSERQFCNILQIAPLKPGRSDAFPPLCVNQLGRKLQNGELGIRILAPVTRASAARAFSFPCLCSVTSRLSAERDTNASRNCGTHTMRARILSLTDSKALKAQLVETQRPASFTRWKRRGFRLLLRRKNRRRLSKSRRTLAYHSENVSARVRLIWEGP
jgi:hypothetical protein